MAELFRFELDLDAGRACHLVFLFGYRFSYAIEMQWKLAKGVLLVATFKTKNLSIAAHRHAAVLPCI